MKNMVYYALPFTKHFPIPQLYPSKTLLKYDDRNHRLYPYNIFDDKLGLLRLTFYKTLSLTSAISLINAFRTRQPMMFEIIDYIPHIFDEIHGLLRLTFY